MCISYGVYCIHYLYFVPSSEMHNNLEYHRWYVTWRTPNVNDVPVLCTHTNKGIWTQVEK